MCAIPPLPPLLSFIPSPVVIMTLSMSLLLPPPLPVLFFGVTILPFFLLLIYVILPSAVFIASVPSPLPPPFPFFVTLTAPLSLPPRLVGPTSSSILLLCVLPLLFTLLIVPPSCP